MKTVVIIGGGLAGLISSIQLVRSGIPCSVIEKKQYPFHRVCGEYVSNEVVPFLTSLKLFPEQFKPPAIRRFMLSSVSGKSKTMPLDLGGFGISRYHFDNFLYEQAKDAGVEFILNEEVEKVYFREEKFNVTTQHRELEADIVIGAFGKRSKIDHALNREFIKKRSPYIGIKYHIRTNHPDDLIALHNFDGGYCGMSNIEDGKTTLCYLTHRENLKRFKNIREMEEHILFKNPLLLSVFKNADFLFDKPEVINEISFVTKSAVHDHILMAGDSAGMIAPLCGNGMAMAIHSAKMMSELIIRFARTKTFSRTDLERSYLREWNTHFKGRLWRGRQIQKLFGNAFTSNLIVNLVMNTPPLANTIIKNTHGEPF
ncbi:MAG: FAD-dependent oxidoreductase [Marivirga sp.]|nr:FAD-dependent oxidoreductase [Marivirga sp.]